MGTSLVDFLLHTSNLHPSELVILPEVDDDIAAGIEHQEQMGEVGHNITPCTTKIFISVKSPHITLRSS